MSPVVGSDNQDLLVYWIVGASAVPYDEANHVRHAIRKHPGAFPAMTLVPALCGEHIKIPIPTSYPAEPRTAVVRRCCEDCMEFVTAEELNGRRWDC